MTIDKGIVIEVMQVRLVRPIALTMTISEVPVA